VVLLAIPFILPLFDADFWINIAAEILIWSLLAASANLLLGNLGLLSFGQALYFDFSMYEFALSINAWEVGFGPALPAVSREVRGRLICRRCVKTLAIPSSRKQEVPSKCPGSMFRSATARVHEFYRARRTVQAAVRPRVARKSA
jgi:hypothetical protein